MKLELDEARQFFADFYYGEHHLPSKIKKSGDGWFVFARGELASTDFNDLTRLVLMAHKRAIRVSVKPHGVGYLKIAIHKREHNKESMYENHPTLDEALERHNKWQETHSYLIIPGHAHYVTDENL